MTALPFTDSSWDVLVHPVTKTGNTVVVENDMPDAVFYCRELEREVSIQFKSLIEDLREEVTKQTSFPHGTMSGRVRGCTGPMCMKAKRDHARNERIAQAAREGRTLRQRTRPAMYEEIDQIVTEYSNKWIES